MNVIFSVGVLVMSVVMRRPPEDAFLRGRHGQIGENELKSPAGFISPVRKIAIYPPLGLLTVSILERLDVQVHHSLLPMARQHRRDSQ